MSRNVSARVGVLDRHAPRPFQLDRPHFGYGSNMWPPWLWLDAEVLSARARPTPAKVTGYCLAFSKLSSRDHSAKANVIPRSRSVVWGVLFDIHASEIHALNSKEGVDYVPTPITVRDAHGAQTLAWMYQAFTKPCREWPWRWYVDLCLHGATLFGLPVSYRRRLKAQRAKRNGDDPRAEAAMVALEADPLAPPAWPPAPVAATPRSVTGILV